MVSVPPQAQQGKGTVLFRYSPVAIPEPFRLVKLRHGEEAVSQYPCRRIGLIRVGAKDEELVIYFAGDAFRGRRRMGLRFGSKSRCLDSMMYASP